MKKKALCKIVISILLLIVQIPLMTGSAQETQRFSYGMQIVDMENNYLPVPSVPTSAFQQGIKVLVTNGTEQSDRFMILCVLNGEVLRFTTPTEENVYQAFYEIGALEEVEIPLKIDISTLSTNENILHIVTIGLLDWIPKDDYDGFNIFSNSVSIPIHSDGYKNINIGISYDKQNQRISNDVAPYLRKITFIPDNGMLDDSLQILYKVATDQFTLDAAVYNDTGRICALFFVDNQLLEINEKQSIILEENKDSVYRFQQKITLSEGVHQIYALWLPLDENKPAFFTTTDKIAVRVTK